MKKLFDRSVRGYYVMSVVIGLLLAFAVATMMEVFVLYASTGGLSVERDPATEAFFSDLWGYLPLNLCDYFWRPVVRLRYLNVFMVTTTLLAVGLFVRMFGSKDGRSKIQQTLGVMLLALCVMLAYGYATRGYVRNAALAAVPCILATIPFLILKRSQQPHKYKTLKEIANETWNGIFHLCGQNKSLAIGAIVVTCCVLGLIFYLIVYAAVNFTPMFRFYSM